jgi:hypothetical protein
VHVGASADHAINGPEQRGTVRAGIGIDGVVSRARRATELAVRREFDQASWPPVVSVKILKGDEEASVIEAEKTMGMAEAAEVFELADKAGLSRLVEVKDEGLAGSETIGQQNTAGMKLGLGVVGVGARDADRESSDEPSVSLARGPGVNDGEKVGSFAGGIGNPKI